MPRHSSSKQRVPSGTQPGEVITRADVANISTDIMLSDLMNPWGMIKAVDATNGPWTADTGITAGLPTAFPAVSGKTFYAWNSGIFNLQSQNWQAAGTAAGQNASGYSAAINKSTPRLWTFGSLTGQPVESMIDVNFMTDSAAVTFVYYSRLADQQGSTTHTDMTVAAEVNGQMMELGALPAVNTAGTGNKYRTITMQQARMAEWRALLPGNCYFIGILVDTGSTVRKAPNKLLLAYNGDSWGEAGGCTLASPIGGAWPTGTHRTHFLPTSIIRLTNAAMVQSGFGGTGEVNANGTAGDANYVNADGSSVFHGVSRINYFINTFGARNPLVLHLGGWNDRDSGFNQAQYQARVQEGIQRWIAAKADIKLFYGSIQNVWLPGEGSLTAALTAMTNGQVAAFAAGRAAYPNNVLGWMDFRNMWPDGSTGATSQRTVNTNAADTIHLHVKGGYSVANYIVSLLKDIRLPQSYYNAMKGWAG
jgi:hypothetical protein